MIGAYLRINLVVYATTDYNIIDTHVLHRLGPLGMSKGAGYNENTDGQALCPHTSLDDLEALSVSEESRIMLYLPFEQRFVFWTEFISKVQVAAATK